MKNNKSLIILLIVAMVALIIVAIINLVSTFGNLVKPSSKNENTISNSNNETEDSNIIIINSTEDNKSTSSGAEKFLRQVSPSYDIYKSAEETINEVNLRQQVVTTHNEMFNEYFGSDITPYDAKLLVSSIKTNNLTASRSAEDTAIGICFVQNSNNQNAANNPGLGLYTADQVDKNQLQNFFNDKNFISEYDSLNSISNEIKNGTSYTINIANSKVASDENSFNTNDVQLGTTGGYYRSGYIRLIYIIENSVIK